MPKKIDPAVKARCVRQVLDHLGEYPSLTAAAEAVARREGLGKETGLLHLSAPQIRCHLSVQQSLTLGSTCGRPAVLDDQPCEPQPRSRGQGSVGVGSV
ncbi:hypothetical protein GCM10027270_35680 [Nocardioides ginkgobilobae]